MLPTFSPWPWRQWKFATPKHWYKHIRLHGIITQRLQYTSLLASTPRIFIIRNPVSSSAMTPLGIHSGYFLYFVKRKHIDTSSHPHAPGWSADFVLLTLACEMLPWPSHQHKVRNTRQVISLRHASRVTNLTPGTWTNVLSRLHSAWRNKTETAYPYELRLREFLTAYCAVC
jgi:hypothetical protein